MTKIRKIVFSSPHLYVFYSFPRGKWDGYNWCRLYTVRWLTEVRNKWSWPTRQTTRSLYRPVFKCQLGILINLGLTCHLASNNVMNAATRQSSMATATSRWMQQVECIRHAVSSCSATVAMEITPPHILCARCTGSEALIMFSSYIARLIQMADVDGNVFFKILSAFVPYAYSYFQICFLKCYYFRSKRN